MLGQWEVRVDAAAVVNVVLKVLLRDGKDFDGRRSVIICKEKVSFCVNSSNASAPSSCPECETLTSEYQDCSRGLWGLKGSSFFTGRTSCIVL